MKKKNGFTLIELLAVIVILAIIATIATPIILGIINDARSDARKRSVELYAKALETAYMQASLDGSIPNIDAVTPQYSGDTVTCQDKSVDSAGKITLTGCRVGTDTTVYNLTNSQAVEAPAGD